jgi:Asp-tRNA(Asn)/Glu-tRNA(Gln) amidotransferase C subunit
MNKIDNKHRAFNIHNFQGRKKFREGAIEEKELQF